MINTVRFSIIKVRISIIFMHLWPKLKPENREFRCEHRAKPSQSAHFATFFPQNRCIYWKTINFYRFLTINASVPTNFMCLRWKVPSEICQKVVSLDLRTAFRKWKTICFVLNKGPWSVIVETKILTNEK